MKSDLKQRRNAAICKRVNEQLGQDEAEEAENWNTLKAEVEAAQAVLAEAQARLKGRETYLRDLLQPVETERVFTQISE